jgi:hypothetical protein
VTSVLQLAAVPLLCSLMLSCSWGLVDMLRVRQIHLDPFNGVVVLQQPPK